jgi:peptidoglycan hydrolase-like protein with peptidoglycan-binding domain
MAGDALFIGWGPVARGRELKALEVFQDVQAYYGSLQQEGKIDGFDTVLLAPHGGDLAGFVLLRGSRGSLDEVRASEEFRRQTARAAMVVDKIGVVDAYTGEGVAGQIETFQAAAQEMG